MAIIFEVLSYCTQRQPQFPSQRDPQHNNTDEPKAPEHTPCPEFAICQNGIIQCSAHRELIGDECVPRRSEIKHLKNQMMSVIESKLSSLHQDADCTSDLNVKPDVSYLAENIVQKLLWRWWILNSKMSRELDEDLKATFFYEAFDSVQDMIMNKNIWDRNTVAFEVGKGYYSTRTHVSTWCRIRYSLIIYGPFTMCIIIIFVALGIRSRFGLYALMKGENKQIEATWKWWEDFVFDPLDLNGTFSGNTNRHQIRKQEQMWQGIVKANEEKAGWIDEIREEIRTQPEEDMWFEEDDDTDEIDSHQPIKFWQAAIQSVDGNCIWIIVFFFYAGLMGFVLNYLYGWY